MRKLVKEYRNRYASVEKMSDGTFDLYNDVTGDFIRTVRTWREAKGHLSDKHCHYNAVERGAA